MPQLKELNERQRQINNKRHQAQGVDPSAANSRYPPKVQLISKYERRTDRRTYGERKSLFEMDSRQQQEKELIKPKGKVRSDWVKPKKEKTLQEEDNEDEEMPEREEPEPRKEAPQKPAANEEEPEENHAESEQENTAAAVEGESDSASWKKHGWNHEFLSHCPVLR